LFGLFRSLHFEHDVLDMMKSKSQDQSTSARKAMTVAELERALADADVD